MLNRKKHENRVASKWVLFHFNQANTRAVKEKDSETELSTWWQAFSKQFFYFGVKSELFFTMGEYGSFWVFYD